MILGTGANRNLKTRRWGSFVLLSLLLLCLCVHSFGECRTSSVACEQGGCSNYACNYAGFTSYTITQSNAYCQVSLGTRCVVTSISGYCSSATGSPPGNAVVSACDTQEEADSLACEINPNLPQCGPQCDTETLDALEAACNEIDGEAVYQCNDDGNVVGYCNLCGLDSSGNYSNPYVQAQYDEYASSCCSSGMAPNPNNFSCKSDAGGCFGANCEWDPTSKVGIGASTLGFTMGLCNVNVTTNIDGEIEGCEDYTETSPESSPSGESSSSIESSSGEGGIESSVSTEEAIANGIEKILDSLHKIIVIDSMNRGYNQNSMLSLQGIYGILDTAHFGGGNDTTIVNVNVPRDTYEINVGSPDVNIDLEGVTDAINANARIDSINGLSLDSIKELIRDLGVDSVRTLLTEQNGVLNGIDSALTDTSGGEYDTSGFMSEIRGWGDSLAAAVWGYPCDTSGGKSCDNAYIGSNGLATAQQDLKDAYSAGVDSIKNGAFGDSLRRWSNLITNNGVLSGAGSASCPSVFTRTWNVPLGPSGMSYTFGPFSKIVCYNFFAGITFWSLARVVLRILVAIGCMMWLYHAVTGTSGGNDDED